MENYNRVKRRMKYLFVIGTAIVLFSAATITVGIEVLLNKTGLFDVGNFESSWLVILIFFAIASVIVGTALSVAVGHFVLSPIYVMLDGMQKLTGGKFETRLDFGNTKTMTILSDSFNSLADELQHTEILRSDFINNFSHEFKTPIVSIKGLAGLMKSGRVTREKELEYLEIIEDEADRLSMMTTNILNLTKIENQGILQPKNYFNLSEQIRVSVLLHERRWREKELELIMDFDEYKINANEDLLKQVWINLIDNAVKFADCGGELSIDISKNEDFVTVRVGNTGNEIPEDERDKIFAKFYQSKNNSSRAGNGIGLALASSIVKLHGGEISLSYEDGKNIFAVKLPIE